MTVAPQEPNVAYDMSLFVREKENEPRTKIVEHKTSPAMQKRQRRSMLMRSLFEISVITALIAVIAGTAFLLINSRIRNNELKDELQSLQVDYAALESERIRLEADLAAQTSAASVDEYITEQGMVPLESRQVHYIVRSEQDAVTATTPDPVPWWRTAWETICGIFS